MIHLINIARADVIADAPDITQLLANILSFFLQIVAIIGIISLVASGILYLTAGGNEDRITLAKKGTTYSIVGIVVALACVIIVKELTKIIK